MPGSGVDTVDFGAYPGSTMASKTVSASGVTSGAKVEAWVRTIDTGDHSADEHMIENIKFVAREDSIVVGTSFRVDAYCTNPPGLDSADSVGRTFTDGSPSLLFGVFNFYWVWA